MAGEISTHPIIIMHKSPSYMGSQLIHTDRGRDKATQLGH
jgi:hypothetical protein